jgi:hypothetical protein
LFDMLRILGACHLHAAIADEKYNGMGSEAGSQSVAVNAAYSLSPKGWPAVNVPAKEKGTIPTSASNAALPLCPAANVNRTALQAVIAKPAAAACLRHASDKNAARSLKLCSPRSTKASGFVAPNAACSTNKILGLSAKIQNAANDLEEDLLPEKNFWGEIMESTAAVIVSMITGGEMVAPHARAPQ